MNLFFEKEYRPGIHKKTFRLMQIKKLLHKFKDKQKYNGNYGKWVILLDNNVIFEA